MINLETFLLLILTSYTTCYGNNVCVSIYGNRYQNGYSYGNRFSYQNEYKYRTENSTCENLEQMHVSLNICSKEKCTITFLGENGILKTHSFSRMENLEQVFLNNTQISAVENKAFSGSPNIKIIHLERNQITQIPEYIFKQLSSLEFLDLHDNEIEVIEEGSFDGCKSLSYLDLSGNKFQNFLWTLLNPLANLKTLNISRNSLDIEDYSYDNSPLLENLIFDHNQISSMECFTSLPHIKSLSLAYNNLESLDNLHSPSLKYLNLSANHITTIENKSFQYLNSLIVLDISKNNLQNLPFELFNNLNSLSHLDLSFNNFTTLHEGVFSGLSSLRSLNLSSTNLSYLESRIFYSTGDINKLDISGNHISYVDIKLLSRFCKKLFSLIIDNNHFTCTVLAQILLNANEIKIEILPGQSHGRKNMNGIACFDEQELLNNKISSKNMENPEEISSFKDPSLKGFNEFLEIQKNLLRNVATDKTIISNYSIAGQEISRNMNSTNELLQKLIKSNVEFVEIQKNKLNISYNMDSTNELLQKLIKSNEELLAIQKNKINMSNKMDSTNEFLLKLIESNKEFVKLQKNLHRNNSEEIENTVKILLKNFLPVEDIARKIDSSYKLTQKIVESIETNNSSQEDQLHATKKSTKQSIINC